MNLTKQTHNAPELWDLTDGFCYELIVLNGIWLLFQISNYPLKGIVWGKSAISELLQI